MNMLRFLIWQIFLKMSSKETKRKYLYKFHKTIITNSQVLHTKDTNLLKLFPRNLIEKKIHLVSKCTKR